MKTPLEDDIETQSDAATFYYAIVVENGIVIDADKGFIRDNGTPIMPLQSMSTNTVMTLQKCHEKAHKILKDSDIDAQEIINFYEGALVVELVTGEKTQMQQCPARIIPNLRDEPQSKRTHRRWSQLWGVFVDTLQVCCDDFVYDKDAMGIAVPRGKHPVLDAYIKNCTGRMPVEETHGEAESWDDVLILDEIRKGRAEIDPDSDENDDDPFSGMWA